MSCQVLVTGSQGFIAKHLIKSLIDKAEELDINKIIGVNHTAGKSLNELNGELYEEVYCCLDNEAWIKCLFDKVGPNIIFQLAARQGKDLYSYQNNINTTLYVCEYCPSDCRIIYSSSSTVYGNLYGERIDELFPPTGEFIIMDRLNLRETDRTIPTTLYGSSKLAGENIVGSYQITKNLKPLILRFCAVIGPAASHGVIPDLIKKLARGEQDKLELFGEFPGSTKPYLHVSDAVSTLIYFGFKDLTRTFNVCPADNISINDLADLVMTEVGINKEKWFLGKASEPIGDNRVVKMDNSAAVKNGWAPELKTSEEAIIKTVKEILNG